MVLSEDHECGVCYERYSRSKHVPRMLFCNHTFCAPCLQTLAALRGDMLSVRCPLCRQISCVRQGLTLEEALWVNSRLWNRITEAHELEVREEDFVREEFKEEQQKSDVAQASASRQTQYRLRPLLHYDRLTLQLPRFLKKMIVPRHSPERIVPGCSARGKS